MTSCDFPNFVFTTGWLRQNIKRLIFSLSPFLAAPPPPLPLRASGYIGKKLRNKAIKLVRIRQKFRRIFDTPTCCFGSLLLLASNFMKPLLPSRVSCWVMALPPPLAAPFPAPNENQIVSESLPLPVVHCPSSSKTIWVLLHELFSFYKKRLH